MFILPSGQNACVYSQRSFMYAGTALPFTLQPSHVIVKKFIPPIFVKKLLNRIVGFIKYLYWTFVLFSIKIGKCLKENPGTEVLKSNLHYWQGDFNELWWVWSLLSGAKLPAVSGTAWRLVFRNNPALLTFLHGGSSEKNKIFLKALR